MAKLQSESSAADAAEPSLLFSGYGRGSASRVLWSLRRQCVCLVVLVVSERNHSLHQRWDFATSEGRLLSLKEETDFERSFEVGVGRVEPGMHDCVL